MSSHVLLLVGLINGEPTPYDHQYLVRFDFLDCEPGECNLFTTPDISQAKRFPSMVSALDEWKKIDWRDPRRPDGQFNRPLTVFSATVLRAP